HAVVYLSLAPKSNALDVACMRAESDIKKMPAEPVPLHIRNAPTKLMKDAGYGEGYVYAHDTPEKMAKMTCLPDSLAGRRYYLPTDQGREKQFKERLEQILEWKKS
ncbi:MAG: replication-associated recombination protein A, partial [Clostridia bacterium]|nr:replication-associated recombination protein A [Clostridia bacterium]